MPLKILIADELRESVERLLREARSDGHSVFHANDSRQAWALITTVPPDICFLETGIPKVNGLQLAERIRAKTWGKAVLLVAMSTHVDVPAVSRAGFDAYLPKPVDLEQFREICRSAQRKLVDT